MEILRETVKEIAIFVIVLNVLSNLINEDTYRKYLRLTGGLILIVIIVNPIKKMMNYKTDLSENFENEIKKQELIKFNDTLNQVDKKICNENIHNYEEYINSNISKSLEKHGYESCSVNCEISYDKELVIESVNIYLAGSKENEIQVNTIIAGKTNEDIPNQNNIDVKNIVMNEFNIDEDVIHVRLNK